MINYFCNKFCSKFLLYDTRDEHNLHEDVAHTIIKRRDKINELVEEEKKGKKRMHAILYDGNNENMLHLLKVGPCSHYFC